MGAYVEQSGGRASHLWNDSMGFDELSSQWGRCRGFLLRKIGDGSHLDPE